MSIYGIDLGTTYSKIARYCPERRLVEVAKLATADGGPLLRSAVYYPANGSPVVGEAALAVRWRLPDRVVIGIKGVISRGWVHASDYAWKTPPIDGKLYTPAQVSSEILKVLKADGEAFFNQPVEDVIIAVPTFFLRDKYHTQLRDTVVEAGQLAGLNVLRLLEEPKAAAFAFAIDQVDEVAGRNILVFDLGGHFDLTLIHCEPEKDERGTLGLRVRIVYYNGDLNLGGSDWDHELEDIAGNRCMEQFQYDPRIDVKDYRLLTDQCEKNKDLLSYVERVAITANVRGDRVEVTRDEFQVKTTHLLRKTRLLLEQVLRIAENPYGELRKQFPDILPLRRDQIEILLYGGATKMPAVEALISETMGKQPLKHRNPDLLVAMGAAYAAYLSPHMPEDEEASNIFTAVLK